jgi:hypothetical protein
MDWRQWRGPCRNVDQFRAFSQVAHFSFAIVQPAIAIVAGCRRASRLGGGLVDIAH